VIHAITYNKCRDTRECRELRTEKRSSPHLVHDDGGRCCTSARRNDESPSRVQCAAVIENAVEEQDVLPGEGFAGTEQHRHFGCGGTCAGIAAKAQEFDGEGESIPI